MSRVYGVVTAKVTSVDDPQGEGRLQLVFPWLPGNSQTYWAPVATMMSGKDRGSWFMPELGDEVLVAFNQGDVNHPYVVGFLWNGEQTPPELDHRMRLLRSLNGHEFRIYDPDPSQGDVGYIRLADAYGNTITMANGQMSIECVGTLTITAPSVVINGRPVLPSTDPI